MEIFGCRHDHNWQQQQLIEYATFYRKYRCLICDKEKSGYNYYGDDDKEE
jgi:hypothetical protein